MFGNLMEYLDIVYLFYGLSFMVMSIIIFSQLRLIQGSRFRLLGALWLLAWFGVTHGIREFIEMAIIFHGASLTLIIIGLIFLIASYVFLFCFGYQLVNLGERRMAGINLVITVAAVFLAGLFFMGITSEIAWVNSSRYFLGFPAGIMSGIGLLQYYRKDYKELNKLRAGKYFILAASFFCIYAIMGGLIGRKADFFPASVINIETFTSLVGIPVQYFRGICALGIAFSLWNIMGIFEKEEAEKRKKIEEARRLLDMGALASVIAHELRNLLAAIRLAVSNIKQKGDMALLGQHITNIEKKVEESSQLVDDLLSYSHARKPHYELVNLYNFMEECIDTAQRQFKKAVAIAKKKLIL